MIHPIDHYEKTRTTRTKTTSSEPTTMATLVQNPSISPFNFHPNSTSEKLHTQSFIFPKISPFGLSWSYIKRNDDRRFSNPNFHFHGKRGSRSSVIMAATGSSASTTDYYSTLNVPRNASLQDIKSSYRKLARKFHPDMNKGPGAEEEFKKISAAYEVLSDDEKRSLYDRFGEAGLNGEYNDPGDYQEGVDPFDVFDAFFSESNGIFGGQGDLRRKGNRDLDIRYDMSLSFEESVFGGEREIEFQYSEPCESCSGSGAKSSSYIKSCTDCGGKGRETKTQRTPFGIISQVSTCSNCGGGGNIITDYCRKCNGTGKVQSKRSMKVQIPAGVSDGDTMQLKGEGNFDTKRGTMGDLYLVLHVKQKHGIRRDGIHLYSKVDLDYTEAILGTVLKVETVEGLRDLRIPSGIQPGDTVKLSSLGVPHKKKPFLRGDHHFIVNVCIPKDISDKERRLVEEIAFLKPSRKDNSSQSHGFNKEKRKVYSGNDGKKASYWNSIKNLFGGNKSTRGFASVSMGIPPSLPRCSKPDTSIAVFISTFVILTCVFTSICITNYRAFLQRRAPSQTLPRTKE